MIDIKRIEIGVTNIVTKETKYFLFDTKEQSDVEEISYKYFCRLWREKSQDKYNTFFYQQPFNYFTYFINDIG